MNILEHNSLAWDKNVEEGIEWSIPVSSEEIARARNGDWELILTPLKPVPREWFGEVRGKDILCLASGGGQQAPILAAAGARVTSFDNSAKQLEQDRFVAERENLEIRLEKGDAADLSRFADESFDLIFHPCSNCFMAKLEPIWRECYRVLRRGGTLLVGFTNPIIFIFDQKLEEEEGVLRVKYSLPYSDLESLNVEELNERINRKEPLEFSHTLEEQIGGQIAAGFAITGFYEDYWSEEANVLLNKYTPIFIATKATKL
ncbi:MAG TPA: class I SAM-dependent methyltransferase [Pyrinomonadaceae bacterium]|nr:class I SAM-dependent methyltransferase [Pyrinomonadaceae bacterium]